MAYRALDNQDEGDVYTGTRVCRKCNKRQSMVEFYWLQKDKYRARACQTCMGNRQRERKSLRKETYREQGFARSIRVKYGLTVQEWERLLEHQEYKCQICKKMLTRKNTHVDHDHKTGKIRGMLCFECNTGLGKFHDDVEWLLAAVTYLQSPYPEVMLRSRDLSKEELKQIRSASIASWHQSEVGKQTTKERAMNYSGERNSMARLTDEQSAEIVRRYQSGGISQYALAKEYGVTQTNISSLVRGKTRAGAKAIHFTRESDVS